MGSLRCHLEPAVGTLAAYLKHAANVSFSFACALDILLTLLVSGHALAPRRDEELTTLPSPRSCYCLTNASCRNKVLCSRLSVDLTRICTMLGPLSTHYRAQLRSPSVVDIMQPFLLTLTCKCCPTTRVLSATCRQAVPITSLRRCRT